MISTEASNLHQESIVIDLHVDPILQHLLFGYDISEVHSPAWKPRKKRWLFSLLKTIAKIKKLHSPFFNHIDIPRMLKGDYTFGAFGIHTWPWQSENGWAQVKTQLEYFHKVARTDERIILAKTPADIREAHQDGKLAAFPGVEGAHCLGKAAKKTKLQRVTELFDKYCVRYLTLAHFSRNDAATPCIGFGRNNHDGLTEFGKEMVGKMNEIGMIIDLAHVNQPGVLDGCSVSKKPVIVSHTGLKPIHDHPRNISNEALKAVAGTGGLVGIMFATNFLSGEKKNPSSEIILKQIDYIVQIVGEDHAAIGSDFDGWIPRIPEDMQDATDLPILTEGMLKLGYSDKRIKKILGENFLRVWEEVLAAR